MKEQQPVAPTESGNQERRFRRWFVDFETHLRLADKLVLCRVYDLSPGGTCISLHDGDVIDIGTRLEFDLPNYGLIPAEVRYDRDGYLGLMFLHDEEGELEVGRFLVTAEEDRRRAQRHKVQVETNLIVDGMDIACVMQDVSEFGAFVTVQEIHLFSPDGALSLYLNGIGFVSATVKRVENSEIGIGFDEKLPQLPTDIASAPLWQRAARAEQNFADFRAEHLA